MKRLGYCVLAAVLAMFAAPGDSQAQDYPSRTVTMVVPYPAGGPTDVIARLVAQSMSESLKHQVIVENVGGAGGTIGASRVAKARPDGYTVLIHHIALAAAPSLYKSLPYDTLKDFEPVGLVNYGPMVLVAKKDYPAKDGKEFFARLKADGVNTTMANAGTGSNAHLCGLLLQQALGVRVTEVAYRGTGPAMNDLISGQVSILCDQTTTAVPQIKGGTIKAYAVTSRNRLDVLPDVPTMIELGLPNFEFVLWNGLYVPKGTPESVVAVLNGALQKALADKRVLARFADAGTQVFPESERSPAAHRARFEKEVATWHDVFTKMGIAAK